MNILADLLFLKIKVKKYFYNTNTLIKHFYRNFWVYFKLQ